MTPESSGYRRVARLCVGRAARPWSRTHIWSGDGPHLDGTRGKEGPVDNAGEVLRRAPLFEALDADGTRELRQTTGQRRLHPGDGFVDEGDGGDSLDVVLDGKMKLTRAAADGREN